MKKTILLAIAVLSFSSAFAGPGDRERDPRFPGDRPGGRMDLAQCLKSLDNTERKLSNTQNQLDDVLRRCNQGPGQGNGNIQRENEELRRDNARLSGTVANLQSVNDRLTFDNSRLVQDNNELRRQLDDLQNGGRPQGFFSYAGCKDFSGNVDLKYIASGEGRLNLESETNAKLKTSQSYSCTYGIAVAATEEIRNTQAVNYCVAGCKDFSGNVDQKYIASATGRNVTEATYNALKSVASKYSCTYGIKVQACQ